MDDYARSGATEVAALINANRLPSPVPVAAGTITIQVLDSAGRITDVSPDADRLVPLVSPAQAAALADDGGAMLVHGAALRHAVTAAGGGGPRVRRATGDRGRAVQRGVRVAERGGPALLIFTPVLFLVFTGAIWLVTGSTLRPIGALRRGAARVTATGMPPTCRSPRRGTRSASSR